MKNTSLTNALLLVIAVALIAIAIRPYIAPHPVKAQSSQAYPFYFEPGTQMLRAPDGSKQVYGRVVVDMRNGKNLGLPHSHARHLPVESGRHQTANLPPFLSRQIRIRRHRPLNS